MNNERLEKIEQELAALRAEVLELTEAIAALRVILGFEPTDTPKHKAN